MDHIFFNAHFYDENDALRGMSALLVRDGRIAAIAADENGPGFSGAASEKAERTDLKGAYVYPGFVDTHLHILNTAVTSRWLRLEEAKSREEMLKMVSDAAKKLPAGTWIEGRGFNEDLWPVRAIPVKAELDAAAPEHPVRLSRVCGHLVIANSLAMKMTGMAPGMEIPDGSTVDLEKGFITENAVPLIYAGGADPGVEDCKRVLLEGLETAADHGLTGLYSDDLTAGDYGKETVMEAYRQLSEEGKMPLRVVEQCALATDEEMDEFTGNGHSYLSGNDMFRVGPRKLYADGSLGAATAWLSVPYADREETYGVPTCTKESLGKLFAHAHEKGFPCVVHAIGDAAAECVLDAVEHGRKAVPGSEGLPDGIVHCQITTAQTLKRIKELDVCVYAQPVFAEYDLHVCRDRVGAEMERTSYNWKTLLESGVRISSGSDCPVESLDPAGNIYCAVTRKDYHGYPDGGWMPEQKLTVKQAIACHTTLAAKAMGFENDCGRIAPGYLADLTVYPESLEDAVPEDILHFKPLMTVVGGKVRLCGNRG